MAETEKCGDCKRQVTREEAYAALDAHLEDYEHKQKPPEEVELY